MCRCVRRWSRFGVEVVEEPSGNLRLGCSGVSVCGFSLVFRVFGLGVVGVSLV